MLNFSVGPVQSNEQIRSIGYEQVPYFRTSEFSKLMLESEFLIKKFMNAPANSRAVFMTGSGTASMEATIMNILTENDKALIVNGGSFGQRFVDLCKLHKIPYDEVKLEFGKTLTKDKLDEYDPNDYTAFIVNVHETSSGVHYDLNIISEFCQKNNLILIVDAISSFLADELDMSSKGIDVVITGSQKALACPPGISIIVLSNRAVNIVNNNECKSMYLDLKSALKNGERGQTPFTPAVSILMQINKRLNQIEESGGVLNEISRVENLANYFRNNIKDLPLEINTESQSNAVTAVFPKNNSANEIFNILKDEYSIWVCPNGGEYKDKVFRVGHIGDLTIDDYDTLLSALRDLDKKGLI